MDRKKYIVYTILSLTLAFSSTMIVYGQTGGLRIEPPLPYMSGTTADFKVWAQSADSYDVNILLVVTSECWDKMPDGPANAVEVQYNPLIAEFLKADFAPASSGYIPLSGTTPGARYQVSSLKDHIDTDGTIYWAMKPLTHADFDPLTTEKLEITITLDSSNPRMLIYLMGKSTDIADDFDMRVPPTIPGFQIPEIPLGSLSALLTMAASALYYLRKK